MAFGQGISTPSMFSLLSQAVGEEERGGALGVGQSLSALGRVLGPSAAGVLFQTAAGLPFFVGGGLLFRAPAFPRPFACGVRGLTAIRHGPAN